MTPYSFAEATSGTPTLIAEMRLDLSCRGGLTAGMVRCGRQPASCGPGTHTLKWRYVKDASGSAGSDAGGVDLVEWSGTTDNPLPTEWSQLTYTYDPAGRRIAQSYNGTTIIRYFYDGDQCLAEYDGNNRLLRKYVYGPGVDEPISMIETAGDYAGTYYYHFDGLGSVIALSDADGNTAEVYEYSVYGQVAAPSSRGEEARFLVVAACKRGGGRYTGRAMGTLSYHHGGDPTGSVC